MPTDRVTRQRRAAVKELLLADLDGLVAKLLQDVVERVPFFAQLDSQQKAESSMIIRWGVTRGIERWVDNEQMSEEDLEIVRSVAVARAQEGRPMNASLRAWSSGARSLIEVIQTDWSDALTTDDVSDLALLTMDTMDRSAAAFESAYTAASRRLAADAEGARAQLVRDILRGRQSSHATFVERAHSVGLLLPTHPVLLTLVAERAPLKGPAATDLQRMVDRVSESTSDRTADSSEMILQVAQGDASAVIATSDRIERMAALAAAEGWYGAVAPIPDWSAGAQTYRLARSAIASAPEWAFAEKRILSATDISVLEALNGETHPDPQAIAREVLGDLLSPENAFLRDTLEVYLAHGSAAGAAALLQIHAQTLRYRLKQIHELTGRDTRSEWDRFVLKFASTALPWSRA